MANNTMRARFPLLLLLGILFLASVSVAYGALAYWEKENPCHEKCLQSCNNEHDVKRHDSCQALCNQARRCRPRQEQEDEDEDEDEQTPRRSRQQPGHRRQWHEDEEEDEEQQGQRQRERREEQEREERRREEQRRMRRKERGSEEEEDDDDEEDEDEDERSPWWGQRRQEQERRRREKQRRRQRQEKEDKDEEDEEEEEQWWRRGSRGSQRRRSSSRSSRNNPFYFPRSKFHTRYSNEHGRIRVLERFDRRSDKLENLQNYRIVQIETRPHTLVLPKHADAESILVLDEGQATVHLANPDNRDSYNLERGDALRIPSGTTSYIVNRNDNQNLRIVKLVIPVNQPGEFDDFFPASNEDQESYFQGFSRNTLEASFNAPFEEIQRILLEDNDEEDDERQHRHQHHGERDEDEGVIVKLSREQVQELTRHAESSRKRRGSSSSESKPFNLKSNKPIYENNFGRFFEASPNKNNPQLQDLDVYLNSIEIKEGGLLLPHINSKATVILAVNEGRGNLELVALRDQNQQQQQQRKQWQGEEEEDEQEGNKQVRRYTAKLNRGVIVVIPAGHPVAIRASSDLHLLAFGINAENNQRNFLAGENDNVLNQIHRQVKELAFPGSGEEVERLLKNQRESHFASAQPDQQQREERTKHGRRGPLSSILNAFY